jgi:hypothetical protein
MSSTRCKLEYFQNSRANSANPQDFQKSKKSYVRCEAQAIQGQEFCRSCTNRKAERMILQCPGEDCFHVLGKTRGKFDSLCSTCISKTDQDAGDGESDTKDAHIVENREEKSSSCNAKNQESKIDGNAKQVHVSGAVKNKTDFRRKRIGEKIASKKEARERNKNKAATVVHVQPQHDPSTAAVANAAAQVKGGGGGLSKKLKEKCKEKDLQVNDDMLAAYR